MIRLKELAGLITSISGLVYSVYKLLSLFVSPKYYQTNGNQLASQISSNYYLIDLIIFVASLILLIYIMRKRQTEKLK